MIDYKKKFYLKNKIVLVTGGCGLIGREAVHALASVGATVIILDINRKEGRSLQQEISKAGYTANYEYFDVTKLDKFKENIKKLVKKYKSLDGLVNTAYPRTKDWGTCLEEASLESWRKNVDMHLNSYAWLSRLVALEMKRLKKKGSIINFSSIYGVVANDFSLYKGLPMTTSMTYSAIKGGIVNFSRYMASYFGKYGIRVNTLCPGGVFDNQNKQFVKRYSQKVPLKRMAKPQDLAGVVVFLISDLAAYITGATIMVDGGWTTI